VSKAFEPYELGRAQLANRVVMAPMTRSRAYGPGASPTDLTTTYYSQRASAGLIVTEGTQPSVVGQGYPDTPGLHSDEQVRAWRQVTEAVHEKGGVIFAQLMHAGRISHADLLPDGLHPVGASPIAAKGQVFLPGGAKDLEVPKELTDAEIKQTIADFVSAARNAIDAGFDGVEIHGANGYLVHQFLASGTNRRSDAWGGSPQERIQFAVAVVTAVAEAIGAERTAIRVSPGNPFNDVTEEELEETYGALVEMLAPLGLAYLHINESDGQRDLTLRLRKEWPTTLILNPFTGERHTGLEELELLEDGTADLLSFGGQFLANPDLPQRLAIGGPFNTPDYDTLYGGDHVGYTDYPALTDK